MAQTNILTTLSQSQSIAEAILAKVKAKGYAVAADLGALASKDEVAKSDLASALASELDAKALASDLTTVSGKVTTLIGNETGDNTKSARQMAAEEVAKVVASAPEDFDTLKEIADWIENDTTGAAKMANDIDALKDKTELGTHVVEGVPTEYDTVKDYVEGYVQEQSYEHPAYTPTTGAETADQTPAFGATFDVSQVTSDATGHITGQTTRTVTIPNATAVASTGGTGGSAGLMSAADKEKLDGADVTAYTGDGTVVSVTNHVISVAAATASASGVGGNAGTMSASDKEKLDDLQIATAQQVEDMIAGLSNL